MRKVAIVKVYNVSHYDDDSYSNFNESIITNISEWQEISEEDFQNLRFGINMIPKENYKEIYKIVEFPQNQKEIIELSVNTYLEKVKRAKEEQEKRIKEEQRKKEKIKREKLLKKQKEGKISLKEEEQLFELLKEKLGK